MFGTPDQLAPGVLLLANPFLEDPNFTRTVILLAEHGEHGTLGFVLSRPAGYTLGSVAGPAAPADVPLYYGGPVELDTLHVVHSLGQTLPGSIEVAPHIFWATDSEAALAYIRTEKSPERAYRCFLGYSGWSSGQLADETEEKSWIITPARGELVWQVPPDELWRETLRAMGTDYAIVANFPKDPRLN